MKGLVGKIILLSPGEYIGGLTKMCGTCNLAVQRMEVKHGKNLD
jgi:hypothetical protein